MKSIGTRFLLPFGLLAVVFSAFVLYRTDATSRQHARALIDQQAALALKFNLAIRDYAGKHVRPAMEKCAGKDGFFRETMSTSFISRSVFEEVQKEFPGYIIRFASDNPRNPVNKANSEELRMIEFFRRNPNAGERTEEIRIDGRLYLAHFMPKWMKEDCLRCHGDPKDAPAAMLKQYGPTASFNRKLGDVAGLDTVAIPLDTVTTAIASETRRQSLVLLIGLVLLSGSVVALFRATVTRRLTAIARHFGEIAAQPGNAQMKPIAVDGKDEIGVMSDAFNELLERLRSAQALLESRVEERTADLAAANEELRREIAERQRAEAALRTSESFLNRIIDQSPFSTWISDAQGTMLRLNQACRELLHISNSEVIGKYNVLKDNIVEEQGLMPLVRSVFETGETVRFDLHYDSSQLTCIEIAQPASVTLDVTVFPILDGNGNITHAVIQHIDVTERKQAEAALRASEERYRRITQAVTDYVYHVRVENGGTTETIHGPACEAVTGYTSEAFAADPSLWIRMVHEEDQGAVLEHVRRAMAGETPESLEHRIRRKDGIIRWVQNTIVPQYDPQGRLLSYDGLIQDITERKQAEESRAHLMAILESTNDLVATATPDGRLLYMNAAGRRTHGWGEDVTGHTISDSHPEWVTRIVIEEALPAAREKGVWQGETVILGSDGSEIAVSQIIMAHRSASGDLHYFSTIMRNITERKRAEESLRQSQNMLAHVLNSVPQAIFWKDRNGFFLGCNDVFSRARGLDSPAEIVGKTDFDFSLLQEEAEAFRADDREVIERNQPKRHIVESLHQADGTCRWLDTTKVPLVDETGRVYGVLGVYEDITEQKRTVEERDRLFNHSMDMLCIAGFDGQFKQINPAWTATLGWPESELLSRPWLDFVHPDDLYKTREAGDELIQGHAVRGFENRYICKDGSHRWLSWNSLPLLDEQTIFCVVRDVTEQKQTLEALRHGEGKLRSIFRAAPIGIGMVVNRVITEANDRLCDMAGYTREELLDKSSRLLYPTQEDYDYVGSEKYKQIAEKGTGAVETRWQRKDGSVIDVLLSSTPLDPADFSAGVTFAALDITERKRAAEELDRAHALLTTAVEQSPAGILIADAPDVKIRLTNPAALSIRGKTNTPLTEIAVAEHSQNWRTYYSDGVTPYPPEQLPLSRAVLKGEVSTDKEAVIMSDDGDKRWISANAGPVRDKTGRIIAGIVVFHDITDRKRAEEDRLRLEAELRHAQKMEAIGTLATGIAHDFNNLLTAISGYTELARSAIAPDHAARQFLDVVDTAVRDASGIAQSLLTFSRKTIVAKAPIDLSKVVRDSLKLLRRILPASITITENLPVSHPVYTYADIGQLHQVLMNLITNACDAMPKGGSLQISLLQDIRATDENTSSAHEPSEATLIVEDTGTGMSPEIVSRVFDPFFTTKPRGKGTGLGMAMVHGIVEEHNGEVCVESQPGKGTRISVRLPCCDPPIQAPDTEKTGTTTAIGRGRTVLLAEDEEFVKRIMIETLKCAGFEVMDFTSGAQTLASFKESPDSLALVILDIDLPEMSGLQCMQEIRKIRPGVPILLVTGALEVDVDEDQDEHLVVLHKPFKMSQLISLAQILLAEAGS